jgi:uncharacterized protein YdhG (YjbR/CyaY superfamily)
MGGSAVFGASAEEGAKVKTGGHKSMARGKGGGSTGVDEYLARVPAAARKTFYELRDAILAAVPAEATETISYKIPAIKYNGIVVWYGAFSKHCSLFPGGSVAAAFKKELKGYSTSKGTIQFPLGKPIPKALVKKIVKARVKEKEGKERRSKAS